MKRDPARLRAALIGYQDELDKIDREIARLRRRLGLPDAAPATAVKRKGAGRKRPGSSRKLG